MAGALLLASLGLFPQEPLRRWAERDLRAALGPGARIGSLHVVPAGLRAEIEDLALEGPAATVRVRRARVALSASSLLGRSLSLASLELDSPQVAVRAQAKAPSGASAGLTRPIVVRNLSISDGALSYQDPSLGGAVRLRGIEVHGGVGAGALDLAVAGGTWERPKPVVLGPAHARIHVSPLLALRLESFEAGLATSRVTASGPLGRPGALRPDVQVGAEVDLAEIAAAAGAPLSTGRLHGHAHVTGDGAALTADGSLQGEGLAIAGWPVDRLRVEAKRQAGETTATLGLALLGGQANGEARLRGSALESRLHIVSVDVARLARQSNTGPVGLEGVLSGDLTAHGDLAASVETRLNLTANGRHGPTAILALAEASGTLRPRDRTVDLVWTAALQGEGAAGPAPRFKAGRATVRGTARGPVPPAVEGVVEGTIAVETATGPQEIALGGRVGAAGGTASAALEARGMGSTLSASVETQSAALKLSVHGEKLDLSPLVPGLRGRATLSFDGRGPARRLSGLGSLRLEDVAWRDVVVGTASIGLEAKEGDADLTFDVPALHVGGRGHLHSRSGADLTATLSLAAMPLSALGPLFPGVPMDGHASGSVDVTMPVARPEQAELRARLDAADVTSGRFSARTTQPVTLTSRAGETTVDDLRVEGPGLAFSASGRLGRKQWDVRATADVDLARLPAPDGWTLAGSGHTEVALAGPPERPRATGALTLRGVAVDGPRVPSLRIAEGRLELDGEAAVIPGLTAGVAGGSVTLAGRIPLAAVVPSSRARRDQVAPGEEAQLDVAWTGLGAAALVERLAPGSTEVDASLSGTARLEGGLAALAEMRGTVSVPSTTVHVADLGLEAAPFEVRLAGGRVTTDGISLSSEVGTLRLAGRVDLGRRAVEATAKGTLELRALSPFVSAAAFTGAADVDVAVAGTLDAPRPKGSVVLRDVTIRPRDIPQAVTDVNATLAFDETKARMENATASVGGGPVTLSGSASLHGASFDDVRVSLTGRDMALRYPAGLKSRVNADITVSGRSGALLLAGKVGVVRALYDLDVAVEGTLRAPVVAPTASPLLRSIGLDLAVEIENPVRVHNNLAELRTGGRLVLRGTLEQPEPYGRFEIEPQGRVYVLGRDFRIEQGRLEYSGTWNPDVLVEADDRIRDSDKTIDVEYHVRVRVEGSLETLGLANIHLESDPSLSSDQLASLLATGTSGGTVGGARLAGTQAASVVTARLGRELGRGLSGLGLGQITLRPELLARETDPGARFTFENQITRAVSLIYSVGLNDAEARFVQVEGRPWRGVTLLAQRRDDGTVTYGVGQRLGWGGRRASSAAEEERVRLSDVRIDADRPLPEEQMRHALHARAGRKVAPWDLQDDADRLRDHLRREGYLEAEVTARLEEATAAFTVRGGPRYHWRVDGMTDPPALDSEVGASLFEEEAAERGSARILRVLRSRGYLRAKVQTRVVEDEGGRTIVFTATPGALLSVEEVRFAGASALSSSDLLKAAGGAAALLVSPEEAVKGIRSEYQKRHFLLAEVDPPRVEERQGRVRVVVGVREGPAARFGAVRFEGVTRPEEELRGLARLVPGAPFDGGAAAAAVERLRGDYLERGYSAARVSADLVPSGPDLDVVFRVSEGERAVIGSVEVHGLRRTRESLVRRVVRLRVGDPLDPRKLAAAEGRLLDLGVFSRVTITAGDGSPAPVRVEVEEGERVVVHYEVRYNDTDQATALLDAERRNAFGLGLTAGGRYRVGADIRESRGSLHVPVLSGELTGSFFRIEEDLVTFDPFEGAEVNNVRAQRGFDIQQKKRVGDRWDVLGGYRFKRVSSTLFPEPITIAGLRFSVVHETRDNPLDPRRGGFLGVTLEVSPRALGSDLTFVKGLATVFVDRPLSPAWLWAQGYRLGLAHGFDGQQLIFDDRFKAGGDSTLRGFATNTVGPTDELGDPTGGQAVVILNQELRYRHTSGLGAAVFYDGGNVFSTVSRMSLDLRHSVGVGLRYASPVGLLRLDVGFPLGRKEGEKARRLYFSLGQVF